MPVSDPATAPELCGDVGVRFDFDQKVRRCQCGDFHDSGHGTDVTEDLTVDRSYRVEVSDAGQVDAGQIARLRESGVRPGDGPRRRGQGGQ